MPNVSVNRILIIIQVCKHYSEVAGALRCLGIPVSRPFMNLFKLTKNNKALHYWTFVGESSSEFTSYVPDRRKWFPCHKLSIWSNVSVWLKFVCKYNNANAKLNNLHGICGCLSLCLCFYVSPLPLSVCLFVYPFRTLCYCNLNYDFNVLAQLSSLIDSKTLHKSFFVLTKGTPYLTFMSYSSYVKYPWPCYKGHTEVLIHRASVLFGNIHASPEMFIWLAVHSFMPTLFCSYALWIELLIRQKPFPYAILDNRISIMLSCQRTLHKELRYGARWKHIRYMNIMTETIVMLMGRPRACFEKWLSAYINSGVLGDNCQYRSTFWKSILKRQFGCSFDILDII